MRRTQAFLAVSIMAITFIATAYLQMQFGLIRSAVSSFGWGVGLGVLSLTMVSTALKEHENE